ncbi:hypothetical protein [Nocardioides sp.]|uniref:hypothetical protein n=1 Tax=Nocardioides sp. TaxID=35761 RepID=UPI002ED643C5
MTTRQHDVDPDLDERLRRTLEAVAATVDDEPVTVAKPRRRRGRAIGAGVTIAALPLAAGAWVQFGPEYVDRIPPANPIVSGSLDGERYWLVDGRDIPRCAGSPSGIELIVEEDNLVGQEWNTTGAAFGSYTEDGCVTGRGGPADTYHSDGGVVVSDGMLWMGALHSEVDEVRASLDGGEGFEVDTFQHEGDTYYLLEVPPGTAVFTVDYLVDGRPVPPPADERREHVVPTG